MRVLAIGSATLITVGLVTGILIPWLSIVIPGPAPSSEEVTLFAHRGGVRDPGVPSNTLRALHAAIERGYSGVELDVREAADGTLIAHHDPDFEGDYAGSCALHGFHLCDGSDAARCAAEAQKRGALRCHVDDLTAEQIWLLRSDGTGEGVATLDTLIAIVGDAGLALMLDFKEVISPAGVDRVKELLQTHIPDRPVYFIGRTAPKLTLTRRTSNTKFGVVRPAHPAAMLLSKIGLGGESFLFQNGIVTQKRDLVYSYRLGVDLIPSLNWHHFGGHDPDREEHLIEIAHAELRRLYRLGVRSFQIDPEFDGVFFDAEVPDGL